ncbi:uncharacterized protein BKCO1_5900051 [Diplodia corticola]|uniref:Uncharacterized protein n=1 Tax=Diplodia corticola TaxID=236234 RepID=A0A1J9QR72_9PEZI|nr:uncharacterized protein BKCO1_5900051 [Diplodia corticola]OJD30514.1 hypothetical protein BKCO1_5900051 [Diplodia corticola]
MQIKISRLVRIFILAQGYKNAIKGVDVDILEQELFPVNRRKKGTDRAWIDLSDDEMEQFLRLEDELKRIRGERGPTYKEQLDLEKRLDAGLEPATPDLFQAVKAEAADLGVPLSDEAAQDFLHINAARPSRKGWSKIPKKSEAAGNAWDKGTKAGGKDQIAASTEVRTSNATEAGPSNSSDLQHPHN